MAGDLIETIPDLFGRAVDRAAGRPWVITDDGSWTYGEAAREVDRIAAGLHATGARPGDRVLVTARNEPRYLFTWLALMQLGAVQVPINPSGTDVELAGFVSQVRPRLIVTDSGLRARVTSVAAGTPVADVDELATADGSAAPRPVVSPDDLAVFIPTSGTTGRSKLVMQTQRAYAWAGTSFPWWMQLDETDRLMTSLPLFHINAPAYSTLGSVALGAGLVLLPRFSGSDFVDAARRHGATEFNAIGAMLEILMRAPERPDDADNPLRRCYTGPSPTERRQREIEERFGIEIVCGYALSESPFGFIWPPGTRPFGTLGRPRQHPVLGEVNEARVVGDEGEVAPGEVGELQLRNAVVMRGYFEMPDETAAAIDEDGWLYTGDLVERHGDGSVTFVGRRKEVIRRRGENLSPVEVEARHEAHPDVAEAAVIGVPSEMSEEEVKAFVVPAKGVVIDVPSLRRHCAGGLARFKVPRYFEVVDELPHTPTGRIAKHRLPIERNDQEVDCDG
jgi:crotonobetaine/carnitine-CoA ligase